MVPEAEDVAEKLLKTTSEKGEFIFIFARG
jgi:hypothetical protein